jgi:RimJ/RimL family protein N-acetyltransferase
VTRSPSEPFRVDLRDGSWALLRPVRPDDVERLQRAFALLSPRSRFLRFHTEAPAVTEHEVQVIASVDQRDHVAWVATVPADAGEPVVGLASYHRSTTDPTVAEAAVVVADSHQGRGLGTALVAALVRVARASSVRVFRNYVLTENTTMLEMFDELGATRQPLSGQVQEVDLALPDDLDDLPNTPAGKAVKALGSGLGRGSVLASLMPPVWRSVRRVAPGPEPADEGLAGREKGELSHWMDAALADEERRSSRDDRT